MDDRIKDAGLFKISNHDYDHMTVDERKELLEKYRMIGLVDEYFSGFWLLVPRS